LPNHLLTSAHVSTRQHTSAYVSIRQHFSPITSHVSPGPHSGGSRRCRVEAASIGRP
jgi:hypothetical protein